MCLFDISKSSFGRVLVPVTSYFRDRYFNRYHIDTKIFFMFFGVMLCIIRETSTSDVDHAGLCTFPTYTTRVFYVKMPWKPPFPRRFNVEYTQFVCRVNISGRISQHYLKFSVRELDWNRVNFQSRNPTVPIKVWCDKKLVRSKTNFCFYINIFWLCTVKKKGKMNQRVEILQLKFKSKCFVFI